MGLRSNSRSPSRWVNLESMIGMHVNYPETLARASAGPGRGPGTSTKNAMTNLFGIITQQVIPLRRVSIPSNNGLVGVRVSLAGGIFAAVITSAFLSYQYVRLSGWFGLSSRVILEKKLLTLVYNRAVEVFFPRRITVAGSHFATKVDGVPGYRRIAGFSSEFTPTLNVFGGRVSVFGCFGLFLNAEIDVRRKDENLVLVEVSGFSIGKWCDPCLQFVDGDVAALGYLTEDLKARVKLQASPYVGCDLSLDEYEELRFRVGAKPNMGYMEFISKGMQLSKDDIPRVAQALKTERRVVEFEPFVEAVVNGGDGDVQAVLLEEELDVDLIRTRPLGKVLPSLYEHDSVIYAVNKSAEVTIVCDRVKKFIHEEGFDPGPEYKAYMNEFVQCLIPIEDMHSGAPDDEQVVLDRQNRPTQKLGYEQIAQLPDILNVAKDELFQKNEVYPELKCPRGIINPNAGKRVITASYIYPLTAYLKTHSLHGVYGFGDAKYLDESMRSLEESDGGLGKYLTDGEKMDATINTFSRKFENAIGKRFFAKEHHDTFDEMHEAQYKDKEPKSKFGTKVDLKDSRRSGEGGTSTWNTLYMAFVFFCWLRENDRGVKESFDLIGLVGGDDGAIVAHESSQSLIATALELGIRLKVQKVADSDPWEFLGITKIPGLSLYAPDVVRFSSKISYSPTRGVPVEQVLYRKCEPYVRLYPNTPLVGNMCRAVVRILESKGFKVDKRYDELCRSGSGYVITMLEGEQLGGPTSAWEYELLENMVAQKLGLSLVTLRDACDKYDKAVKFSDFPSGFIKSKNMYLTSKYEALIRDLYIPSPPVTKIDTLPTEALTDPAVQISADGKEQTKSKSGADAESVSTSDSRSVSTTGSKKKKRAKKKTKSSKSAEGSVKQAGDGLSKDRPSSA